MNKMLKSNGFVRVILYDFNCCMFAGGQYAAGIE